MKKYGKIENGVFTEAKPERIALPDGRGYQLKWISDADLESGKFKEIVTTADCTPQTEAMVRAGRAEYVHKDIGEYILRSVIAKAR